MITHWSDSCTGDRPWPPDTRWATRSVRGFTPLTATRLAVLDRLSAPCVRRACQGQMALEVAVRIAASSSRSHRVSYADDTQVDPENPNVVLTPFAISVCDLALRRSVEQTSSQRPLPYGLAVVAGMGRSAIDATRCSSPRLGSRRQRRNRHRRTDMTYS